MFDMGITEMMLIGIVALVVIGPERLPGVARTAGKYFGRLKRFMTSVKADVEQELRADELRQILADQQRELDSLKDTISDAGREIEKEANAVSAAGASLADSLDESASTADNSIAPATGDAPDTDDTSATEESPEPGQDEAAGELKP
ncbi:MAG: twin-arginine translocase subunit TatB [Gammaproteobacteria bacterium]|nr:twin-arginine translocase subunit TatB [Gammaproteobacteria bacterium]